MSASDSSRGYVDSWGGGPPWQAPEGGQLEPTLFGGVMAAAHLETSPVVEVVRSAVALVSSWIGFEVTWSTVMFIEGDEKMYAEVDRRDVDWGFVTGRGGMTASIHVTGACTAFAADPVHPKFRVAEVVARFPAFVPELGLAPSRIPSNLSSVSAPARCQCGTTASSSSSYP